VGAVGKSSIEFGGHGFWTRDPLVEALLASLVVELDDRSTDVPWLDELLDDWTVQALAGFIGCIDPGLDWHLFDAHRVDVMLQAARRVVARQPTTEFVEVTGEPLERRAARLLTGTKWDGWEAPSVDSVWLGRVTARFVSLLEGRLVAPKEAALFVGRERDVYFDEPPRLVVRRWLVEAAQDPPPSSPSDLLGALVRALHDVVPRPGLRVTAASSPALADIVVEPTEDGAPQVRLLASDVGRLVTAFVEQPAGGLYTLLTQARPDVRQALWTLGLQGWRYIPSGLLVRPYDGPTRRGPNGPRWSDALFGELASLLP
jgi:hypothetical protein